MDNAENERLTNELSDTPTISVAGARLKVLRSCNSYWLFDPQHRRFRRVPKETDIEMPSPEAEWETYFDVELAPDSPAFVVMLNAAGTRLLRSWRHSVPCTRCGPNDKGTDQGEDSTAEISLEELNSDQ